VNANQVSINWNSLECDCRKSNNHCLLRCCWRHTLCPSQLLPDECLCTWEHPPPAHQNWKQKLHLRIADTHPGYLAITTKYVVMEAQEINPRKKVW